MKIILSCIFLFFFFVCSGLPNLIFSEINSSAGLSDNNVRSIAQLPDGRMVFRTEGLTNIYNGTSFTYLHTDDRKKYMLDDYYGFHHTYIDGNGNIWIKDFQELVLFNMETEQFVQELDSHFGEWGIFREVTDFFIDIDKDMWFVTDQGNLWRLKKNGNLAFNFMQLPYYSDRSNLLLDIASVGSNIYLFYGSGLIICVDKVSGEELYRDSLVKEELKRQYSNTLLVVAHDNYLYQIWNGNNGGVVYRYDVNSYSWVRLLTTDYILNTLTVTSDNEVLVSCREGLWLLGSEPQEAIHFPALKLVDGELIHTEISVIYADNQQGLWVGTLNRGLLYYHPARFKFLNIGPALFDSDRTTDINVKAFCEWGKDILLVSNSGVYFYDELNYAVQPFRMLPPQYSYSTLINDNTGSVWAGTENFVLLRIYEGGVREYRMPFESLYEFTQVQPGRMILGTSDGLYWLELSSGSVNKIDAQGQRFNDVYQLARFDRHRFIGLSENGLFVFDIRDNRFIDQYDESGYVFFQQKTNALNAVFVDSRGMVWFAAKDGLSLWNSKTDSIKYFYVADGLVNNNIKSILEDDHGCLWLSTSNGITMIRKDSVGDGFYFSAFNKFDGVVDYEFSNRSAYKASNGHLFWGGLDGFNCLNPEVFKNHESFLSKPVFVAFELFGEPVLTGRNTRGRILLPRSLSETRKISLKHKENFITFYFTALNYVNPTQTYYRYRLKGLEEKWNYDNARLGLGRANYTGLPWGTYTLQVSAEDNSGSSVFSEMRVVIEPPFWATRFAHVLYVLLGGLIIYGIAFFILRRSRQRLAREHERKLNESKFKFLTNISHELRTPLSLIISPLDVLIKKAHEPVLGQELMRIYDNAMNLMGMVNQLLDFRRLEVEGVSVQRTRVDIKMLLEELYCSFKDLASSKLMIIEFECDADEVIVEVDKDKLVKIVSNLISNAIKYTPEKGEVLIILEMRQYIIPGMEELVIHVHDNGLGIPKKEQTLVFNRFYRAECNSEGVTGSGIGLHLAREYAELLEGTIEVKSSEGTGSVFTVKLPVLVSEARGDVSNRNRDGDVPLIVVVEDHPRFRAFLCEQLNAEYKVVSAENGKKGWEVICSVEPDLVVSDVMMPVMSGLDLCRQMRNEVSTSHIPIILLTARSSDEAQLEGFEAKADAYVTKPFNMDVLFQQISNLMEQRKHRQTLFRNAMVLNPNLLTNSSVDEQLIKKVICLVEKNIENQYYTVEQLGKDMAMDRTGLFRKLQAVVGQSPSAFIRSIRLKHAARLLSSGYNVSEVAAMVGFGSLGYFGKCFQKEFGVKPSLYREPNMNC